MAAQFGLGNNLWRESKHFKNNAPVAQLDRVLGYEPSGREFDKCVGNEFERALARPQGWKAGCLE